MDRDDLEKQNHSLRWAQTSAKRLFMPKAKKHFSLKFKVRVALNTVSDEHTLAELVSIHDVHRFFQV
jgi:hypothetical protein